MTSPYHNQNVLVTGGAGFIGSHMVEHLVALGARVTVIDDLSSGSLKTLEKVYDKITFINQDVTNFYTLCDITRNHTSIFHLAAMVSVSESFEKPFSCYQINVMGTLSVLEAARINQVPNVLFASSSAVYGNSSQPCHENRSPAPTSPYGYSKLQGELVCKQYAALYGINTIITRYFNVFGERQNPHGAYAAVVAKFRSLMRDNKPITIYGDGLQKRDFISVNDIVTANTALLSNATQNRGQIFNIATGQSITLISLFNQLKMEFPSYTHTPLFEPARSGDIHNSQADCTKFKEFLYSLNSGE